MKESIKKRIEAVRRGEVPEGYCRVHPYVIPNDWEVVKLENITKRTSRPNKDGKDRPVYSINNRKGFVPQNEQFEEGSYEDLDKSAYKIVRKGEFAYNPARVNVGSIGRLREAEEVAVSSLYVCVSVDDKVDGEYFDAWTKSLDFYKETVRNTEGSVREYLFYENFANMRMPIPSRAEQKKISAILATCDRVIELKQSKIDELNKLKQTYLRKMFPQKGQTVPEIRFPGFSDPWEQRKLGQVSSVSMCRRIFKEQTSESGDIPFYKIGTFGGQADAYISSELFTEYKTKYPYPKEGDILISASGSIGRTVEFTGKNEYFQDSNIVWLSHDDRLDNTFLKCFYTVVKWAGIEGSTIKRLYNDNILNTVISLPTVDEQRQIGSFFKELDNLITLHQRELEEYEKYKKALMQLLLTGLVRVNA